MGYYEEQNEEEDRRIAEVAMGQDGFDGDTDDDDGEYGGEEGGDGEEGDLDNDEFTGQEDYDAIGRGKEDEDEENPDDPEKKKDDPNAPDKNKDGAKDGKDKDGKKDEKKKDEKKDGGEELEKAKQAAAPPIKKWKRFEPMWTLTEVKRFAVHILTSPVLKRAIKKMPAHPAVKVIVPIAFHFLPAFVEKIESADPFIEPWGEIAFKIIVLGKPEIRITLDNAERLWKMLESRKELQSD